MLQEHPARRDIVAEMHLRRWPIVSSGMQIVQIFRAIEAEGAAAEHSALLARLSEIGASWELRPRHVSASLPGSLRLIWERHSEASSLALFSPEGGEALAAALRWAEDLPGAVLRATRIDVVSDDVAATAKVEGSGFNRLELVSCTVAGAARIWSDFRIGDDGFGYVIVAANGLQPGDLTRCIQCLQDLGNYRNLALLGLPAAREAWPRLDDAERELRSLGDELARSEVRDDELLGRLCRLSLGTAAIAAATAYRMSATAAYAQLVEERLAELGPERLAGFPSLVDFSRRRFLPAVRTCASFSRREAEVNRRTAHVTSLLRTRIETRIENQNARVLAALNRSAGMQLRLQHLVEGLSVVAISYYCVALLSYVLAGVEPFVAGVLITSLHALAVPVVLLLAFVGLRHMRRRTLRDPLLAPQPH